MNPEVSPIERSRQILREIELELNSKEVESSNTESPDSPIPERLDKKQDTNTESKGVDTSPIYENEIGSATSLQISLDQKSILQGIIFSEILREPKTMRRNRR